MPSNVVVVLVPLLRGGRKFCRSRAARFGIGGAHVVDGTHVRNACGISAESVALRFLLLDATWSHPEYKRVPGVENFAELCRSGGAVRNTRSGNARIVISLVAAHLQFHTRQITCESKQIAELHQFWQTCSFSLFLSHLQVAVFLL